MLYLRTRLDAADERNSVDPSWNSSPRAWSAGPIALWKQKDLFAIEASEDFIRRHLSQLTA
jgi:hypothetical protein